MSLAAVIEPDTDVPAEELTSSTKPLDVIGDVLDSVDEAKSRTVPALMPVDPTDNLDVELEIVRSPRASIRSEVVVIAPLAVIRIVPALTALLISTPLPLTSTFPPVDVSVAPVPFVIAPEPERVMLPEAWIAPVGATDVPPLMVIEPAEVKVPEPVYVPEGVIAMFPELVVVWFPFTAMLPPIKLRFPAIDGAAAMVIGPVFPDLPMVSPVVPVKAQVESNVVSALAAELNEVEEGTIETVPDVLATTAPTCEFAATSGNRSPIIVTLEVDVLEPVAPNSIWFVVVAYCKSIPFCPKSTVMSPDEARKSKFLAKSIA